MSPRIQALLRPATGRGWRSALGLWAGGAACLVLGLVAGLYLCFPVESLRQRLEQEAARRTGREVRIVELRLLFPPGLAATQVTVTPPGGAPLTIERLSVRPLWSSLAGSDPGIAVHAELFGGRLDATLHRRGTVTVAGSGLQFALPLPQSAGLGFAATLRELDFAGTFPPLPTSASRLRLNLEGAGVTGLQALGLGSDRLTLGTVSLAGSGQGTTLRLERIAAEGGMLLAGGEGSVLLASPPEQSRLNLNLTLHPGAGLDPLLAELLPALAKPAEDGSLRLALGGTLARPSLR